MLGALSTAGYNAQAPLTTVPMCMQMLEFNVPGGKLNRGMAVLDTLKALRGNKVCRSLLPHVASPDSLHYTNVLSQMV